MQDPFTAQALASYLARVHGAPVGEVRVTPLEVCRARDTKGLYRERAAAALPGVHVPYEAPRAPELVVRGDRGTPDDAANAVTTLLASRRWI